MKRSVIFLACLTLALVCSVLALSACGERERMEYSEGIVYQRKTNYDLDGDLYYNYTVTGLDGHKGDTLVIPPVYNGMPVTHIAEGAFEGCTGITTVILPETIASISESAFYGCEGLETVVIPDSVNSIGNSAFQDCKSLRQLSLPEGLTRIGVEAFQGCERLESVTIPKSVRVIDKRAFADCEALRSLTLSEGTTTIRTQAFQNCKNLQNFSFPAGLITVESRAFYGCESLTRLHIPKSVTTIGAGAFAACTALSSLSVERGNPNFYVEGNCLIGIYDKWTNLVQLQGTIRVVLAGLNNSTIPNGVSVIDDGAFQGRTKLQKLHLPASVTMIGKDAFLGCSGLVSITADGNSNYYAEGNCLIRTYENTRRLVLGCSQSVIPEGVTYIVHGAFSDCEELQSIHIPASVTAMDPGAFIGCKNLESFTVAEDNPAYYAEGNCLIEKLEDSAFPNTLVAGCKNSVIPNGVTRIADYAFADCASLTAITIPETVLCISTRAFLNCTGLRSIVIPESVNTIYADAFEGCTDFTVYCKCASRPSLWSYTAWPKETTVVWGYKD